tara:strand:+ start:1983 stop:8156 length:6174 start_codon:yes stop_codon:yes gene_type:complete
MPEQWTDYERERARQDVQDLMNLGAGWGQKLYPHQAKGPLSDFEPTTEDIQTTWSQGVGDTQFKESTDFRQSSFGMDPGNLGRALDKAQGKEIQPANVPQPAWGSWEKLDEQGKMAHMFQVVEKAMEEDKDLKNEVNYDFDQALIKRIPFAGAAAELAEQLDLGDRAQRITQDKGTPRDYLEIAKVMHNADYWENEADWKEETVSDVSSIATFGAEFYLTAGTGTLTRAVGKKLGTEVAKKLGLKALLKKYAGASVKKLLSPTTLRRTAVMGPTMAGSIYHGGRGNIGQLEATQDGGFEFGEEEDSAAVDVLESVAMAYAEIAIEELLPHGFVDKLTGGMKSKLTRGIGKLFGREASERTGKGMMSRAGLGSLAEELTEERMVEIANTVITRDPEELGVLAGDMDALAREARAMATIQSPRMISALIPGKGAQRGAERIQRDIPTEPLVTEQEQAAPLEQQEVPLPEQAPPVEQAEEVPEVTHEQQIDNLAQENNSSRRDFENVVFPDGTTLLDWHQSKAEREEFLEQHRALIAAREAPVEEDVAPERTQEESEKFDVLNRVLNGWDFSESKLSPNQKHPEAGITSEQYDEWSESTPEVRQEILDDKLQYLSEKQTEQVRKRWDEIDNRPLEFQPDSPVEAPPVSPGAQAIHDAEIVLAEREERLDDTANPTAQQRGHVTRVRNKLKRLQAEQESLEAPVTPVEAQQEDTELPDDTMEVEGFETQEEFDAAQEKWEAEQAAEGVEAPPMEAAANAQAIRDTEIELEKLESQLPLHRLAEDRVKIKDAIAEAREKLEKLQEAQEAPPTAQQETPDLQEEEAAPVVDGSTYYAEEIIRAESTVREQEKILSQIENPTKEDRGPLLLARNKLEGLKESKAAIEAPPVEEAEFGDDPVAEENAVAVSQIDRIDVMRVFPGRKVTEDEDGNFDVQLEGGRWRVLVVDAIESTKGQLTAVYNSYVGSPATRQWSRDNSGKLQTFEEVYPTVESYIESDPSLKGKARPSTKAELEADATWDVLGTIEVARGNGTAQQIDTLSHEAVHAAHLSGLWTAKEWAVLVDEYSDPGSTTAQQSEDIAKASQGLHIDKEKTAWEKPEFMERMVDWMNRMLSKIGLAKLSPRAAQNMFFRSAFFNRQTDTSGVIGQIRADQAAARDEASDPGTMAMAEPAEGEDADPKKGDPKDLDWRGDAEKGPLDRVKLAVPTTGKYRRSYLDADKIRDEKVITKKERKLELRRRRSGTAEEVQRIDDEMIETFLDPEYRPSIFDMDHARKIIDELQIDDDPKKYELSIQLSIRYRDNKGDTARITASGRDPESGLKKVLTKLKEAIFMHDKKVLARIAKSKKKDPVKRAAGERALKKEHKRIAAIRKYMEKLGYEWTDKGFRELTRNRRDMMRVIFKAIRSKKSRPVQALNMVSEAIYMNLLSGFDTLFRNGMSNIWWGSGMEMEELLASLVNQVFKNNKDIIFSDYLNARRVRGDEPTERDVINVFKTAFSNAWVRWTQEYGPLEEMIGVAERQKFEMAPAIPGEAGKAMRMAFGLGPMSATDQFAKTLFSHFDIGRIAQHMARVEALEYAEEHPGEPAITQDEIDARALELKSDTESKAWVAAMESALQKTFQDDGGPLSKAIIDSALKVKQWPGGGGFVMEQLFLLFVRTPVRFVGNVSARTPFLGTLTTSLPKMIQNRLEGRPVFLNVNRELVSQLGVLLVFTLLMVDDEDPEEGYFGSTGARGSLGKDSRKFHYQAIPTQGQRIGKTWYKYDKSDPMAVEYAMLNDIVTSIKGGRGWKGTTVDAGKSLLLSLQDKTFLRAMGDISKGIESEDKGRRFFESSMTRLAPGLISQTLRHFQDDITTSEADTTTEGVLRRMGLKRGPKIYTSWGEPAKRNRPWLTPAWQPAEQVRGDRVFIEWNKKNVGNEKFPSDFDKTYKVNGNPREFELPDLAEFERIAGTLAHKLVMEFVSESHAQNPDLMTVAVTKYLEEQARTEVKNYWKESGTWDVDQERMIRTIHKRLKKSSMLDSDSYKPSKKPKKTGDPNQVLEDEIKRWEELGAGLSRYIDWYKNR